jgi:NitT/TauT family transport system ATP-binding protein
MMNRDTEKKLYIENLYKSYDGKVILDDIDLQVTAGELVTVVGPSGCGKSTLLKMILGQEVPDSTGGKILIDGKPVGMPNTERGIVYQKYGLFPHLTVLQNVVLGKTLTKGSWWNPLKKNLDHIEEAMSYLQKVRLGDAAHKFPHELSGGMQQRVAIAQALIMQHPILLMDEPFGALDPDTRQDVQLYLLELWEQLGLTIFFVTHDMSEACYLGSRLIVLSQYYTDDRGNGSHVGRGGKVVGDYQLPSVASSTDVTNNPKFTELLDKIRDDGFDPSCRQHVNDFNLQHSDAFVSFEDNISKNTN